MVSEAPWTCPECAGDVHHRSYEDCEDIVVGEAHECEECLWRSEREPTAEEMLPALQRRLRTADLEVSELTRLVSTGALADERDVLRGQVAEAFAVLRLLRHHRMEPEDDPIPSELLNREYALLGDDPNATGRTP